MVQRRSSSEILKKRARPTEGISARLILKYSLLAAAFFILFGVLTSVIVYFYLSKDLPKISPASRFFIKALTMLKKSTPLCL